MSAIIHAAYIGFYLGIIAYVALVTFLALTVGITLIGYGIIRLVLAIDRKIFNQPQ